MPFDRNMFSRSTLAASFFRLWGYLANDKVLGSLFNRYRGRCYEAQLTFAEENQVETAEQMRKRLRSSLGGLWEERWKKATNKKRGMVQPRVTLFAAKHLSCMDAKHYWVATCINKLNISPVAGVLPCLKAHRTPLRSRMQLLIR